MATAVQLRQLHDGGRVLHLTSPTGQRHRSRSPDPPGAPDPADQRLRELISRSA